MKSLIQICVAFAICGNAVMAADPPKKVNSLDKQLRNSLDDDLLKDLPVAPKKKPENAGPGEATKKSDAAKTEKLKSGLDAKLLDQLGEGEDVNLNEPTDPLSQIGSRMRKVEALIQKRD